MLEETSSLCADANGLSSLALSHPTPPNYTITSHSTTMSRQPAPPDQRAAIGVQQGTVQEQRYHLLLAVVRKEYTISSRSTETRLGHAF